MSDGLMDDILEPIQKNGSLCIDPDLLTPVDDDDREYWKLAFLICIVVQFAWELAGLCH